MNAWPCFLSDKEKIKTIPIVFSTFVVTLKLNESQKKQCEMSQFSGFDARIGGCWLLGFGKKWLQCLPAHGLSHFE
jgi:hypothetical protein